MCYSVVKCGKTHLLHILVVVICSKVVPESKCQRWHHETALSAMSVKSCTFNILISILCCLIISHIDTSLKNILSIIPKYPLPDHTKPGSYAKETTPLTNSFKTSWTQMVSFYICKLSLHFEVYHTYYIKKI